MTVVSVDVAYKDYRDPGIAVLSAGFESICCEFVRPALRRKPEPTEMARYLSDLCSERGSSLLMLDGPQGWKDPNNGIVHCRVCERILNTPAKTGLPGSVKPADYTRFVAFSIGLYDRLTDLVWTRMPGSEDTPLYEGQRLLVESFPLSAWRALELPSLPAKRRARSLDLTSRLEALTALFPIRLSESPDHDEFQALVAGLAGIALRRGHQAGYEVVGEPPFRLNGSWREGFIVNPLAPNAGPIGVT